MHTQPWMARLPINVSLRSSLLNSDHKSMVYTYLACRLYERLQGLLYEACFG